MDHPPLNGLIHYYDRDRKNEQIWDGRYFPVMTIATNGAPTMDLMQRAYQLRDPLLEYAKVKGIHCVLLSDLSRVKVPDAATRKQLSDLAKTKDIPFKSVQLATIYTVTNPLVRGVVTAVAWVAGDAMIRNIYVSDVRAAITEMEKVYRSAGKEKPDFPNDYEFAAPTI